MTNEEKLKELQKYIERAHRILTLCSPQLDEISSDEDYRMFLQKSFLEIGELGLENIETLEKYLNPLLEKDAVLSDDDVELLQTFSSMLMDTTSMENIDLPVIYMQAQKLLENAEQSGDTKKLINALDGMVIAAYMMINLSIRLYPEFDDCFHYRDEGMKAARKLLEYLDHDKFLALPDDECREIVLINARYIRCLFEWGEHDDQEQANREDLELLRRALSLVNDPFYVENAPGYDWTIHTYRTLQYLADFTEDFNKHNFTEEQLVEIYGYTQCLVEYLKQHPELEKGCPKIEQEFYMARNSYFAGESNLEDYRNALIAIMRRRDSQDFSARGMFVNFTAPLEYIYTLDPENLTQEQQNVLRTMYGEIASYVYRMPKTGVLSFMLTFLSDLLKNFIEVPRGTTFRSMCRRVMAAMHPPTYVHSLNVAAIARYLAVVLIGKHPELFEGVLEDCSEDQVVERSGEILDFVYNSALLHDIGKLFIVETILTYGRKLVDYERMFIQTHTVVGAALLKRFPTTAEFADIALGHHKWYDGSRGYPDDFNVQESRYRTIIALVEVADCIDAATDNIGRSYKEGLSLDEVIAELEEGSGSRYAPYVVELLHDPDVKAQLQRILTDGRDENYRITYHLLNEL